MHCTNSLRKTTLTILDTRRLRLHSTFWTTASAFLAAAADSTHHHDFCFTCERAFFTATSAKAYTTCDSISGSFISLRTRAWSLDSHLHSSHIILWGDQTAAKSYGKLQKRSSHLFCNLSTSRSATRIWRKRYGLGVFLNYLGNFRYSERCYTFSWMSAHV